MQLSNDSDLRYMVMNAPIGICVLNADTLVSEMVNDAFLKVAGKPYEAIYGRYYWDAFTEARPYYREAMKQVVQQGEPFHGDEVEWMLIRHGREEMVFVTFVYHPIKNQEGKVTRVAVWILENTMQVKAREEIVQLNSDLAASNEELAATNEELQQTQESLRQLNEELEETISSRTRDLAESRARLLKIVEQAPLGLSILSGPEQVMEMANDTLLKLLGKDKSVFGMPYAAIRSEPEVAKYVKLLKDVYTTGIPFTAYETQVFVSRDYEHGWGYFNFTYQPIRDELGDVTAILTIAEDVTEKVLARQENDRVNRELQMAIEAAQIGSWQLNPVTLHLDYSPTLACIYGYEGAAQMTYEMVMAQIPEQYHAPALQAVQQATTTGGDYDITYAQRRFNDGRLIWIRSLGKVTLDEQGQPAAFTGVVMEVTAQVKAQQAIEDSEKRFRNMAESSGILIGLTDEEGNANYFNQAWEELTGRPVAELMIYGWAGLIHPEDRDRVLSTFAAAFEKQEAFNLEFRICNKDGEYCWLMDHTSPRFHPDGTFAGYTATCIDITERKQDEQRKNDFIGMVSHELKTPLTSMSGYLQMLNLKANQKGDQATANVLDKAYTQIKKMTAMINGFLNVSRLESGKIHMDKLYFNMAELLKEMEDEAITMVSTHRFIFEPAPGIFVTADRDKICQVIQNLISNAAKYSPAGSTIKVTCAEADGHLQVCVQDEGMGISPQDIEHLFERYYRVENTSTSHIAGFGIGLYLCAEIIQRHQGRIWVESQPGQGSSFYFSLPLEVVGV